MSAPVETKVTAATAGSVVSAAAIWALATYVFPGNVPEPIVALISLAVAGVVTFISGYAAKHTPRPDLRVENR